MQLTDEGVEQLVCLKAVDDCSCPARMRVAHGANRYWGSSTWDSSLPASGKIFTSSTSMRVMKSTGTRSCRRAQTSTRSLLSLPRSSTLRRQTRWWLSKTSTFSKTAALICKLTCQHRTAGGSSWSLSPSVKPQVLTPPYAANARSCTSALWKMGYCEISDEAFGLSKGALARRQMSNIREMTS